MMRRRSALLLLLLFSASLFLGTVSAGQQARFRVLAFYSDKTEPDHVRFAQAAVRFLREHAVRENFAFEATTHWEDLNDERLKSYQLVIWLNESPAVPEQRRAFERYMEGGGAWLGFHAAGYNDKDTNWRWYVEFLGGAIFEMNSWPPLPARLRIDDRSHPVTAGLRSEFESPANEWYVWKPSPRLNPDVRVLATFDPANYPIGFKDVLMSGDLPAVWSNTKYKMVYMNMGHGDKIVGSATQDELIDRAVNWLGAGTKAGALSVKQTETSEARGIRISPRAIGVNAKTGEIYAVNTRNGTVMVLDGDGHFVTNVRVGDEPEAIAINPETNRVYVANSGSGSVSVLDGATDQVIADVPVGDQAYTITVDPATNKIYVTRTFSDVTTVIDGKTNEARIVKAGVGDAVAAESLAGDVYFINYESPFITVLDGANDRSSKIEAPMHLWAMAANPVLNKIYAVSAGSANVTIIDGKTHTTRTVSAGEIPCAAEVDSGTGKVFIANYGSDSVTVMDGASDAVLATVKVGAHPQAIAVDSGDHKVYVVSMHEGKTTILDGLKDAVLATVQTGRAPFAVVVQSTSHKAVTVGLEGELTVINGKNFRTYSASAAEQKR